MKQQVEYLRHYISNSGISVDNHKIKVIQNWSTLTTITEVRSFLGLATYYWKFVKGFLAIAAPLTGLLHKDKDFDWQQAEQQAFDQLKLALTTVPVLILPNPDKPFIITTDASDFAIGAVLSQDQGKGDQPITFESRKMSPAELNYPVHEKELLAMVHAITIWRPYLEGQQFTAITDHASLEYIKSQKTLFWQQARWLEVLQSTDFIVKYWPRKQNEVADTLL